MQIKTMSKRIGSFLVILAGTTLFLNSCDKNDDAINTFHALVDASKSSIADAKYQIVTVFSTDNGATFLDYPKVGKGGTYLAKAVNRTSDGDVDLTGDNCFDVDWSESDPQPTDPTADVAEFTLGSNNDIKAVVTNLYTPYNASSWVGDWIGIEDGACCSSEDPNTIRQDTSNPNKFIMDNFWGDGVDAYVIFSPSTNLDNQTVNMPTQTTSENGIASGAGTYDQCTGTFMIATSYKLGSTTYKWDYFFVRE